MSPLPKHLHFHHTQAPGLPTYPSICTSNLSKRLHFQLTQTPALPTYPSTCTCNLPKHLQFQLTQAPALATVTGDFVKWFIFTNRKLRVYWYWLLFVLMLLSRHRPPKYCDLRLESCSGHGCFSVFSLLCHVELLPLLISLVWIAFRKIYDYERTRLGSICNTEEEKKQRVVSCLNITTDVMRFKVTGTAGLYQKLYIFAFICK
jgi:hypothetical protein